jgi:DNA-binding protein H-NS
MGHPDASWWEEATVEDLRELETELHRARTLKHEEAKRLAVDQIKHLTQEHELTYEEVIAAIRTTTKRRKAPPVYRNPSNPRQTWSGKGDPPDWFISHPDPESLRITGA